MDQFSRISISTTPQKTPPVSSVVRKRVMIFLLFAAFLVLLFLLFMLCLNNGHFLSTKVDRPVPYSYWSVPIKNGRCQDVVYHGKPVLTCTQQKRRPDDGGDPILHNEYRFSAGIFEIGEQLLVPRHVSIIGAVNPNGDPQNGVPPPPPDQTTLFLATKGVTDYDAPYCKASNMVKTRVGFVLSGHNTVKNVAYQGIDTIRPRDNGTLCGGGVFETKGCAEYDCNLSDVNNANSDGKAATDVLIENVRLNDYYYEEDKAKIGESVPGNADGCNDGCDGCKKGSCCFCQPNNVRSSQVAVWVPQTRDVEGTRNVTVRNLFSRSSHADGINFHGYLNTALVENTTIENTGDDSYALWGADLAPENVVFRNTHAVNPGIMRPDWYGVCYATYGFKSVKFDSVGCRSPQIPMSVSPSHPISSSMISFNNSFGAKYPVDHLATVSNGWTFENLEGESYTAEDGVNNTMTIPTPGKMTWTRATVSSAAKGSSVKDNVIGPFYFTDSKAPPLNVEIV